MMILPIDSPASWRCVDELWDGGKLFNDDATRRRFQDEWCLRVVSDYPGQAGGVFEFRDDAALAFFLLRWS